MGLADSLCMHLREDIEKKITEDKTLSIVGVLHVFINPNSIRSYKIVQKLSPKQAARGVAQSPYPIYRHGKACLSKQPPWRTAGDPRLARGRSQVRALGPAGAFFLHPPFLPPSGDSFLRTFPTKPMGRLGLIQLFAVVKLETNRPKYVFCFVLFFPLFPFKFLGANLRLGGGVEDKLCQIWG